MTPAERNSLKVYFTSCRKAAKRELGKSKRQHVDWILRGRIEAYTVALKAIGCTPRDRESEYKDILRRLCRS